MQMNGYSQYDNSNLPELLDFIDPGSLTYQEWINIGFALKDAGFDCTVWDAWSARDGARYHAGECEKKWRSFSGGSEHPVTAGTLVHMALDAGYMPHGSSRKESRVLDWNDVIGEDFVVTSAESAQEIPVREPAEWNPVQEISTYLSTLFESSENVGYVTECWESKEGKFLPTAGSCDRTAGKLLEELAICEGDIGAVFGDYNPECGAWIRFNPLDGKGVKNENVTDFRYALVESDKLPIEQQNGILHELRLPIACLVYSGGKSLHAIVRVEAGSYSEYRQRVDFLYSVCDKNGLKTDRQNRNPSRLSRMPGVMRKGRKQYIIETNIGCGSWAEWKDYIDSVTDDLPEFESMADAWENMPELSPPLIEGVLRQGHKMLIAGPSKAGKSYALIEMSIAIAEGRRWLGWQCAKGRVLYVNLELDRASCLHRFKDVYKALDIPPVHLGSIDIWNLRGVTEPMDKLAPKLIRRAKKRSYIAVIIDPIYKVITGDENSADQMAHFCNQFDKVCTQLGCAVIYCHHHSKGAQGGKRSMDRASGSGVFARDPDALIDMTELNLTDAILKQEQDKAACMVCTEELRQYAPQVLADASPDDLLSRRAVLQLCRDNLSREQYDLLQRKLERSDAGILQVTAWRMEGTLREFPKFAPKNLWFRYPVHVPDDVGILKDLQTDIELAPYQRGNKKRGQKTKETYAAQKADKKAAFENAFDACNIDGTVTVQDMSEYLGVSYNTIKNRVKDNADFKIENGNIYRSR
ncbi:MAG: AAA family ATPase [Ruminococcus sp.]